MIKNLYLIVKNSHYLRDIAWLASGNAIAQIIAVLAMPVLTRLYSPEDFAIQNLFLQLIGFFVVLLTWRYEYFIQLPKKENESVELLVLVLCLGMVGVAISIPLVWLFQDNLANWMGFPMLKTWLVFVPLTAALISFSIAFQHLTQRNGLYRHSSLAEVVNKGTYVSTAIGGYFLLPGPAGLLLSTALGAVGKIIWLSRILWIRLNVKKEYINSFEKLKIIKIKSLVSIANTYSRLSGSMVVSHILLSCTSIIPSIFISRFYDNESLGQFALVSSTIYLPSGLIGGAIGQVYYQRAAESWSTGKCFSDLWRTSAKQLIFIGVPIYTVLGIISPWVYPFIFGELWSDAGRYASLMAIVAFFSFATVPLDRGCLVVGAWWYLLVWHTSRALTTVLVVWLAWQNNWDIFHFLIGLVVQMSLMYLVDYWMNWRFASRVPVID
jgi:teichuronic acid exporter